MAVHGLTHVQQHTHRVLPLAARSARAVELLVVEVRDDCLDEALQVQLGGSP